MSTERGEDGVEALRRAARGEAQAGVELLRGARPSLLDATSANAVSSLVLAAFVTGAALFRGQAASVLGGPQFDLIASVLRCLALAFVVRAAIATVRSVRTLLRDGAARDAVLALGEEGLLLKLPGSEQPVARSEVLGVTFEAPLPSRTLTPRAPDVQLVLTSAGGKPRVVRIPPYFAPSAEITVARLQRWLSRGDELRVPERDSAAPEDPELHYQAAARGQHWAGEAAIPDGGGYLLRAPYTALLGLVFALDVLRTAGPMRAQIVQPVLAAAALCVALIVGWLLWMQRRRATRLGLGMLLTPDELLLRGKAGVVAVPWPQLVQVEVGVRPRWSPFVGPYAARTLTLTTQEQQHMLFDQSFLGTSVEAIALLCKSYRDENIVTE